MKYLDALRHTHTNTDTNTLAQAATHTRTHTKNKTGTGSIIIQRDTHCWRQNYGVYASVRVCAAAAAAARGARTKTERHAESEHLSAVMHARVPAPGAKTPPAPPAAVAAPARGKCILHAKCSVTAHNAEPAPVEEHEPENAHSCAHASNKMCYAHKILGQHTYTKRIAPAHR